MPDEPDIEDCPAEMVEHMIRECDGYSVTNPCPEQIKAQFLDALRKLIDERVKLHLGKGAN